MSIKYKNAFGEILTEQQVQIFHDHYKKEFYENDYLKKIEFYHPNSQPSLVYYLSSNENLTSVVSDSQSTYRGGTFYFNRQLVGTYTVWDWEFFDGVLKKGKGKKVFNDQGNEIAYQEINPITMQVLRTIKKYYLQNLGEFAEMEPVLDNGIFEFDYNDPDLEAAEINVMVNLPGFEMHSETINKTKNILLHPMIAAIFTWSNHSYYHSALPLIPS